MAETYLKDPDEVENYTVDFTAELSGASINTVTVTADAGITVVKNSNDGSIVTLHVSGGTAGTNYQVIVEVTTSTSPVRTLQKGVKFKVRDDTI